MSTRLRQIQPVKPLTGAAERAYRAKNPYSDHTKNVQTRFVRQVDDMHRSNKGVSSQQLQHANELRKKWNLADPSKPQVPTPQPFDQEGFHKGMQDQINNMYDQQKQARLAQLQTSRDKAISGLRGQMSQVAPEYQAKRNQSDVVNNQNVKRLREIMASNGLQASGENLSANVALNNERQNSINSLNLQEQQTMDDFERRIADVNDASEESAIMSALEGERSRSLYDAYNRANDVGYQRSIDARDFGYRQSRDARRDAEWESETKYGRLRDKRRDAEWESQQKADRAWREYTFRNMSASERAQLEWAKKQYGEDAAWRMYEKEMDLAQNAAISKAELDYYKDFPLP